MFSCSIFSKEIKKPKNQKKIIILSIDGFPGYYLKPDSQFYSITKNLRKLISKSNYSNQILTTYPSITYPAHTSMITGVDPSQHGIYFNIPLDPLKKYPGSWLWYDEEIKVKTLLDIAKENYYKTGNIYWPVTVGAKINFNIPQYWKNKTDEDEKLLRALSTAGLYDEIKNITKSSVLETTGDEEKIDAAIALWKLKKPEVMLVYTTDLDSIHHEKGIYSAEAKQKLQKIDSLVGKFIEQINLYKEKNLSLIVVSDHGFKEVKSLCYPNHFLIEKNLLNPKEQKWNYYFKTHGGGAILLENPDRSFFSTEVNLEELKKEFEEKCPTSNFRTGESLKEIQEKFHPNAIAALDSESGMAFSESSTVNEFFRVANPTYFNHGFPPDQEEIKTILISYPKKEKAKLESVKDVFTLACNWLQIKCKKNQSR